MLELTRGQRVKLTDLSTESRLKLTSQVDGPDAGDVMFAAMLLDEKGIGTTPTSIVAEEQQVSSCGSIVLRPREGGRQTFEVDLSRVPAEAASLMFVFSLTGAAKKRAGPAAAIAGGQWTIEAGGQTVARYTFTQADIGADTAVMLGEVYRKSGAWRVRSVGDGFTGGLPTMLSRFRINAGAVASNSPRGSVVLASAPQGLWLPKTWPGGVQPAVPKDLTRAVGLTITRTEDGTVHTGTGFMVSPGGHFVTRPISRWRSAGATHSARRRWSRSTKSLTSLCAASKIATARPTGCCRSART
jgi:stress response protein SCP2